MFRVFVLWFSVFILNIHCFNLDTKFPIVYEDPAKNSNSYFGYSVLLYPGNDTSAPWVMVGSPQGNNPNAKFRNTGVVYKCGIREKCTIKNLQTEYTERKLNLSGSWFGGSMDINVEKDRLVVCAYKRIIATSNDYRTPGACYWSHIDQNDPQQVIPLSNTNLAVSSQYNAFYYGQGQAGFSVHLPPNSTEMILGAPGVFNWAGTPIKYYDDLREDKPIASRFIGKRSIEDEFAIANVAENRFVGYVNAFDLFGYSVTSGSFTGRKRLYVSGAPRASSYQGKIVMYNFNDHINGKLIIATQKIGTQFGEYFGSSLASGDINGDNLDDLIVGSPFYVSDKFNEGRITIFLGDVQSYLKIPNQVDVIDGLLTNGQFGSAVMFLGDLNNDGFGDIAVSAPYEDENTGVLYIYGGSKDGLKPIPTQKIFGKNISPRIRGFGASISKPTDIDGNKYSDLAIGSYLSGHAVVLRSKPTVLITHTLKSVQPRLETTDNNFTLAACYYFTNFDESVNVTRTITVDENLRRGYFKDKEIIKETQVVLIPQNGFCENVTVDLKGGSNYYEPVAVSMTIELVDQDPEGSTVMVADTITGMDRFCQRCPVVEKFLSKMNSSIKIPYVLGCGSDNICYSNLTIQHRITNLKKQNEFTLGSSDYLKFQSTIENTGEHAYSTELIVTLPDSIYFRQIPATCVEQNTSTVVCQVDNPLEGGSQKTVELDLDMKNINSRTDLNKLTIRSQVKTSSENPNDNVQNYDLVLVQQSGLTMFGNSGEQSYTYGNISFGQANFSQTYQVEKLGVSPIDSVLINIRIPHAVRFKNGTVIEFLQLHRPHGRFGGQIINFKSNFNYVIESNFEVNENIRYLAEEGNTQSESKLLRKRRQVEILKNFDNNTNEKLSLDDKMLHNRTFHLNCDLEEIICTNISATVGPFKKASTAVIQMKMILNIAYIKDILESRDIVVLRTDGYAEIENPPAFNHIGDVTAHVSVLSLFVGESVEQKIALWIIILAVIVGILLLLLVILGLVKAGFFKRAKKEELKKEKEKLQQDADDADNDVFVENQLSFEEEPNEATTEKNTLEKS